MLPLNHFNKENTELRIGNPGCGKTFSLVADVEKAYSEGVPLHRIALFSHSNAAVDEAKDRVLDAVKAVYTIRKKYPELGPELTRPSKTDMVWFRTTHSVCFKCLDLDPSALLTEAQCREFGKTAGIPISGMSTKKTGYHSQALAFQGDKMLHWIGTAALRGLSIREYVTRHRLDVLENANVQQLEKIAQLYADYKRINMKYDFNDMILLASRKLDIELPDLDLLIIDEAQDLNPMQWLVCNRFAEKAKRIIIAGDDKQAINDFAGATPEVLMQINAKVKPLCQSYRVPLAIYTQANRLRTRHMHKYVAEGAIWKPALAAEGLFRRAKDFPILQLLQVQHETWFLQARTTALLNEMRKPLLSKAYVGGAPVFGFDGGPPIDLDLYVIYEAFMKAKKQRIRPCELFLGTDEDTTTDKIATEQLLVALSKVLRVKPDKVRPMIEKSPHLQRTLELDNAFIDFCKFLRIEEDEAYYIKETYKQYKEEGASMFANATIQLGTIHSFKGREADNTIVMLDVPAKVAETIIEGETDVEARILFTAITRAKKRCFCWQADKLKKHTLAKYLS